MDGISISRPSDLSFPLYSEGRVFSRDMDILLARIYSFLPLHLLAQEAAGITVMVYDAAVQEKKPGLYIFSSSLPHKASVAFIDDILMAFGESVNCTLFHG